MTFVFDKYKLSRALEKEGFYEREKADVFADIFSETFSQAFMYMLGNTLASKQDVEGVKEEVRGVKEDFRILELRLLAEIEKSRSDSDAKHAETQLKIEQLRSEIERSKADTIKCFIGLLLGQAALIAALVKLL